MKELISNLKKVNFVDGDYYLLDTCFFISCFEHHENISILAALNNIAMTSFNIEELLFVEHNLKTHIKEGIRKFLRSNPNLLLLEIPVHPGNREIEENYVNSADSDLLKQIHDPSDAVLIATAIINKCNVVTKDKHHLYTTRLENFLNKYNIKVEKELRDINKTKSI
jgi:predicted nucleic acid-binding protein